MRADVHARRADELVAALSVWDERLPSALELVASELPSILCADKGAAYDWESTEEGFVLGRAHTRGFPPQLFRTLVNAEMRRAPEAALAYHPGRPDPRQLNRVLTREDLRRLNNGREGRLVNAAFGQVGLSGRDQLRVLIGEEGTLLCWLGALRPDPFTEAEAARLRRIAPAVRRRLSLERRLDRCALQSAALMVALEAVASAAALLRWDGRNLRILEANHLARGELDADRAAVLGELRAALSGAPEAAPWNLTRLALTGVPGCWMAIRHRPSDPGAARLERARRRWGLTARQVDVLRLLSRGAGNKAIAAELGCAAATVEIHVSALLARSGTESRAQLVSKFFSEE